jgi:hypothetical protein
MVNSSRQGEIYGASNQVEDWVIPKEASQMGKFVVINEIDINIEGEILEEAV